MKSRIKALAANPIAYVIGLSLAGSASVVAGVGVMAGTGWALVSLGIFMIAAASYITKGMKPNG